MRSLLNNIFCSVLKYHQKLLPRVCYIIMDGDLEITWTLLSKKCIKDYDESKYKLFPWVLSRLLKDTKWQRHNQIFILTVSHLQIFTVKSLDEYHIDIDDNDEVEANEQSEDVPEVSQQVRASESKLLLLHLDLLTAEHHPGDRHVSLPFSCQCSISYCH